jgi:hypothetical protein
MNKLRVTFRSNPTEVFDEIMADLALEWPVVGLTVNGTVVDSNIDLVYTGNGQNRNIIVKEFDVDLTKNFDTFGLNLSVRKIHYEQTPGLGYQSQEEDSFISDAEYNHINEWSTIVFTVAEIMKLEYSEDNGATWDSFHYEDCYSYMVPGGLFNGKELVGEQFGEKIPGSSREKLNIVEMKAVAKQLGLPYTNDGCPVLARSSLGFDTYGILNYNGQSDISSVITQEDLNVDQYTVLCVFVPD